jgi:hypothetical protein
MLNSRRPRAAAGCLEASESRRLNSYSAHHPKPELEKAMNANRMPTTNSSAPLVTRKKNKKKIPRIKVRVSCHGNTSLEDAALTVFGKPLMR